LSPTVWAFSRHERKEEGGGGGGECSGDFPSFPDGGPEKKKKEREKKGKNIFPRHQNLFQFPILFSSASYQGDGVLSKKKGGRKVGGRGKSNRSVPPRRRS